ncbi:unnamed protein product (macronuclear) [Paramecium tetraurelia]|uniref:Uncharacterized protein n=1 Tax=Paramecium tetraurelia TaxID=5888 RepID=A0D9N9_PARTE|nr:uncharacterized protein GSPATT00014687001 [Paramecium tetraurelia]CAK79756.1 unnamed protein product [Paramecium tetraurelia]|eukprot:XP_001447153.1 hypothetical protein (macronuclear) [Paramecium tetraurelia strain d4-2]
MSQQQPLNELHKQQDKAINEVNFEEANDKSDYNPIGIDLPNENGNKKTSTIVTTTEREVIAENQQQDDENLILEGQASYFQSSSSLSHDQLQQLEIIIQSRDKEESLKEKLLLVQKVETQAEVLNRLRNFGQQVEDMGIENLKTKQSYERNIELKDSIKQKILQKIHKGELQMENDSFDPETMNETHQTIFIWK